MTYKNNDLAPVVLIEGDGIGPEISEAVVRILAAADAGIDWIRCDAGGRVFAGGDASGLPRATIDAIRRCGVALKAPLATPIGHGERSANVTIREEFETFASVRPVRTLPGTQTSRARPDIDLILVRENFEDLYIGIEYDLGDGVVTSLKVNSAANTRRICETAFFIARSQKRRRVTGISKSNILKLSDGMFDRIFDEVAARYPEIESDRLLVDASACKLVTDPSRFDVLVTSNLYGDILSDLVAGLGGGLGVCASINLGDDVAIYEAVHGSAPDIAGRGIANPTALLRAALLMLDHIGRADVADRVDAALEAVLTGGETRTADLGPGGTQVGTGGFADAVIAALSSAGGSGSRLRWVPPSPGDIPGESRPAGNLRRLVHAKLAAGV
ncbi:isocitrate/isopropylmalate family dehydrogenase [Sphingomonas bacterium]|uniref:isocitrate/isopropylmalate family dehydrogenase n=1 Tax=Sphingomonas bacterium TaxID=1895847 RepID=UPI001576202E|nr:isocitrate/isopropylmalate family dehydrogenase [Sphingomonas bacterium]